MNRIFAVHMFQNKDSEPRETHQWSQFQIPASPFSSSQDFQKNLTLTTR